jgi:hypothetical protein
MADAIDELVWQFHKTGNLRNYSTLFTCSKGSTFRARLMPWGKVEHRCRECGYFFEQTEEEYHQHAVKRQLMLVQCVRLSFRKKRPKGG